MALTYWIAPPPLRMVVVHGRGVVTQQEAVDLRRALQQDDRFAPDFRELVDLRDVTDIVMTRDSFHGLAAVNPYGAGARRAIVAPADLVYGVARMWQLTRPASEDELEVFRELSPALAWLGVTESDLPASG